jgi:hypothetical protein
VPFEIYPEDLVSELSEFARNGVPAEAGFAVADVVASLTAQGEEAVPAVRQFLEEGGDAGFDKVAGLNPHSSLRLALFEVLHRIGGAAAEMTLLAELQSTANPLEIAILARFLDEQAPGVYHHLAVAAARETLQLTQAGQLSAGDVGPLFEVLHAYGDAAVLPDLQNQTDRWEHYATIALGELTTGEGIPVLVERMERRLEQSEYDPTEGSAIYQDKDLFALQILAQVAVRHPQALEALLEQAAAGRIPEALWPKLSQALAAVYLFQTTRPGLDVSAEALAEDRPFPHVRIANEQILYIRNRHRAEDLSAEERDARVATIDEMLAVTESPRARGELEKARDSLWRGQW